MSETFTITVETEDLYEEGKMLTIPVKYTDLYEEGEMVTIPVIIKEKRQVNTAKVEARKLAKQKMSNSLLKTEMTFNDFKMKSAQLYYMDDMQTVFQNQCRSNAQNTLLQYSDNWKEICELRKIENHENVEDENIKKELAKLIKRSLVEVLNVHPSYKETMTDGFTTDNVDGWITDYSKKIYERDSALVFLELGESQLIKEVTEYLETLPIYTGYCKQIRGLGAKTAAKLIAGIGDIRRFENPAKLLARSKNLYFTGNVILELKKYITAYITMPKAEQFWSSWYFDIPAFHSYVVNRAKKERSL